MRLAQTNKASWLWLSGLATVVTVSSLQISLGCMASEDSLDNYGGSSSSSGPGGSGGGLAEGGAGGPDDPPSGPFSTNQCPRLDDESWAEWFGLAVDQSVLLQDADSTATDDYSSYCGGGADEGRPDVVYSLEIQDRGTLTITTEPNPSQPVVYVESECGVRTTFGLPPDQLPCIDAAGDRIQLGVIGDQQLFVIVEGAVESGAHNVRLTLTEPICGDGVINPASDTELAEQCDFGTSGGGGAGGAAPSNGCDESCRFETPVLNEDQCPGPNIDHLVGAPFPGHTLGFSNDYQAPCAPSNGPDRVYSLALQENDQLDLLVEAQFDVVLSIMTDCDETKPAHCQDSPGVSTDESLQFTAPAAGTYYIVVDGYDAASWGTFELTAQKN